MSKFIQITSSAAVRAEDRIVEFLYALDDDGNVWSYIFDEEKWVELPSEEITSADIIKGKKRGS